MSCTWIANNYNTDGEVGLGYVTSAAECVEMVQEHCDWANIAQVYEDVLDGGSGACYCQTGTNMDEDPSSPYFTCFLSDVEHSSSTSDSHSSSGSSSGSSDSNDPGSFDSSDYLSGYTGIVNGEYCSSAVIVGYNCVGSDEEGMVCAHDDEDDQAYCSYDLGSNACAYCDDSSGSPSTTESSTDHQVSGYVNNELCADVVILDYSCNAYGNATDPDYDEEGMVCANEGEENEAYCSYWFGSSTVGACAYCNDDDVNLHDLAFALGVSITVFLGILAAIIVCSVLCCVLLCCVCCRSSSPPKPKPSQIQMAAMAQSSVAMRMSVNKGEGLVPVVQMMQMKNNAAPLQQYTYTSTR